MKLSGTLLSGMALTALTTLGCGGKKDSENVEISIVPKGSALVLAGALSSCTDVFNYESSGGSDPMGKSIQNTWVAQFNYFTVKYTVKGTDPFLNWWNIRIVFDDAQVKGGKYTCSFLDDFDALVDDLTRSTEVGVTNPTWNTTSLDSDGNTVHTYQTGRKCKVICKGLNVADNLKNQKLTITGTLKLSAYAFANQEDGEPKLVTASTPVQIQYEGDPN